MMLDGEFGNPRTLPRRIDRDEPVHLAIEPDLLDDAAAIGLQRAAVIVQLHPHHRRDEPVRRHRSQTPRELILARLAPARDDIIALVELG